MNQKELTKAFMMISNWKKSFGCDVFYKLIKRFKGLGLKGYSTPYITQNNNINIIYIYKYIYKYNTQTTTP